VALVTGDDPQRWTEAVLKLVKMTRDGRLTWTAAPGALVGVSVLSLTHAYETNFEGWRLRLQRGANRFLAVLGPTSHSLRLDVVDKGGDSMWTFPNVEGLTDLYQAIRYRDVGVSDLVNRLLAEP
jgi:hypothetical protein